MRSSFVALGIALGPILVILSIGAGVTAYQSETWAEVVHHIIMAITALSLALGAVIASRRVSRWVFFGACVLNMWASAKCFFEIEPEMHWAGYIFLMWSFLQMRVFVRRGELAPKEFPPQPSGDQDV